MNSIILTNAQEIAFQQIVQEYEHGGDTALVLMPGGAGKTFLAQYFVRYEIDKKSTARIAYVSPNLNHDSYVGANISRKTELKKEQDSTYICSDLLDLISSKVINENSYDIVIFDGMDELGATGRCNSSYEYLAAYFNCFKVSFSRGMASEVENRFKLVYEYSYEESLQDGSFIRVQKIIKEHNLGQFHDRIEGINIGDSWTKAMRESMLGELVALEKENKAFQKALDMLLDGRLKKDELVEMSCRVEQLDIFRKMLDDDIVDSTLGKRKKGCEALWQQFFESNQWIFGFGLNYIFNASLDGDKLEKTVVGFDIKGAGKRVDALLRTTGLIQTLTFGEIKTHKTAILKNVTKAYRAESWAISDEFSGGIAQVQRTVQESLMNISSRLSLYDEKGFKKPDSIYLYKPKAFLIIGSLDEFRNENGEINESKFSSFELFRRSISDIEVITFDELYNRACALVHKSSDLL